MKHPDRFHKLIHVQRGAINHLFYFNLMNAIKTCKLFLLDTTLKHKDFITLCVVYVIKVMRKRARSVGLLLFPCFLLDTR